MTLAMSTMTGGRATEGKHLLKGAINVTGRKLQLVAGYDMTWVMRHEYDIIHSKNEFVPTHPIVSWCVLYLLFGRVKVFRSGLKEHSDLLTLGDVDWQLNEGLGADKSEQES